MQGMPRGMEMIHGPSVRPTLFRELFASEVEVFFVATGTAANTLAIASLTEPWQRVVCHRHAHWNDDESTAPERITLCRTTVFSSHPSKLIPADLQFIAENGRGDVHQPAPGVVTISNPTEFGTVYRPEEIRALTDLAHNAGYLVHCDGRPLRQRGGQSWRGAQCPGG